MSNSHRTKLEIYVQPPEAYAFMADRKINVFASNFCILFPFPSLFYTQFIPLKATPRKLLKLDPKHLFKNL